MQVRNYCLVCEAETKNPKFCSSSCAASFNNRHKPKRTKKQTSCRTCGSPLTVSRNKYCSPACDPTKRDWSKTTIAEIQAEARYQGSAQIRRMARKLWQEQNPKPVCFCCGYTQHVEVCHIKSIASFDAAATVAEVNAPSNLVGLCPNHHWEFDRGLLRLPGLEPGPIV
ncbi:HNH endonuclease [Candidatus Dependentiae bacterium]|nr:MAG: HNH endonuclease [Candidatus Dependentiae bacterium]